MLLSWGERAGERCRQRMLSCFVLRWFHVRLEAGCKSTGGRIYHILVAVNIPHCLVYEGYRDLSIW
jgi:hypothetical protein